MNWRSFSGCLGAVAALIAPLAGAGGFAHAATIRYEDRFGEISLTGDPGRNEFRLVGSGDDVQIRDRRATIAVDPSSDCIALAASKVRCPYLDYVNAGGGADVVKIVPDRAGKTVVFEAVDGGDGRDRLIDGDDELILDGGGGADVIRAGGGEDEVFGSAGPDVVRTGDGNDVISRYTKDKGRDEFVAGRGNDTINAFDRRRDAGIACGPGRDRARFDKHKDPAPSDCERKRGLTRPPDQRRARSLFGVVSQGPLGPADYERMGGAGVSKLRVAVNWYDLQPAPETFDWSSLDHVVAGASANGVRVLPFIWGTPPWLVADAAVPPIGSSEARRAWRQFLRALVARYGTDGKFWSDHATARPIREWQIWNEPNFSRFYHPKPSARGYGQLIRISGSAIHDADRRARVVLGGIAAVHRGTPPLEYLRRLYAVPRIRRSFDAVALHPYATTVDNVRSQIYRVRGVMADAGDRRTALELTELGWASAGPPARGMVLDRPGQARMLRRTFAMLRAERHDRRISGAQWFAWQDASVPEGRCSFCQHSGLFTVDRIAKPSWRAFRQSVGR